MKKQLKKCCPACKSDYARRVSRKWWMHYIPKLKHYECNECYKRFIAF